MLNVGESGASLNEERLESESSCASEDRWSTHSLSLTASTAGGTATRAVLFPKVAMGRSGVLVFIGLSKRRSLCECGDRWNIGRFEDSPSERPSVPRSSTRRGCTKERERFDARCWDTRSKMRSISSLLR